MESTDITVEILKDIRGELRGLRESQNSFKDVVVERFEAMDSRFEVIKTALRDMSDQLLMQSRAIASLLNPNVA